MKPARFSGWVVHINLFCLRNQSEMEGKSSTCEFESFISPTFCQRDGIGRRVRLRSGCLYGVEGSSPSAGISYDRILQRRMTIRLHASFVFVVLGEDSGIFRDTRVFR